MIAEVNPFTQAVELIRFALYLQFNGTAFLAVTTCLILFLGGAILSYDPGRGFWARRGGPAEQG